MAFERLADSVRLIEKDEDVAAVWHTIFNLRYGKWLADRIVWSLNLRQSELERSSTILHTDCHSGNEPSKRSCEIGFSVAVSSRQALE